MKQFAEHLGKVTKIPAKAFNHKIQPFPCHPFFSPVLPTLPDISKAHPKDWKARLPYICAMQGKIHSFSFFGIAFLLVLTLSWGCGKSEQPVDGGPKLDTLAPEFSLLDSANQPHHLQEYLGQKTAIVFSVNSCGHCEELIADMATTQPKDYPGKAVIVYKCDAMDDLKLMQDSLKIEFPFLLGTPQVFREYAVKFTPMIVLLDEKGIVRKVTAAGSADKLKKLLAN